MPQPKIYNTHMLEIIQKGANIQLGMNRSKSIQIREPQKLFREESSRALIDGSIVNIDLKGLDNSISKIPKPVYQETYNLESPRYSLTTSQTLNTLSKEQPFQINIHWIRLEFEADYNRDKRDWYFKIYDKEKVQEFRELFYQYMEKKETNYISLIGSQNIGKKII